MVATKSAMLPLGTRAAPFALPEPLTGATVQLEDVTRRHGLLVAFICNHCPFVVMQQDQLRALGTDLAAMDIGMVGISSNDVGNYPQDGPEAMKAMAGSTFSTFKYLFDETQEVAKAYHAACTPDVYLFDKDLKLVYRYVNLLVRLLATVFFLETMTSSNGTIVYLLFACLALVRPWCPSTTCAAARSTRRDPAMASPPTAPLYATLQIC